MHQEPDASRRERMAVLSRCDAASQHRLWGRMGMGAVHKPLRGPESGLVMLRGRIGGTGEPFNIGEATVTRASVQLEDGSVGHAVALGRDKGRASLAAVIDAFCRDAATAARIDAEMIAPLRRELDEADEKRREQTATTRVDFFTMVRGED